MRWLREPLLHFAMLGALLFALHAWLGVDEHGDAEIVVRAQVVEALAKDFERAWERPATRAELDELIGEYVREEVYYREAVAAGLDHGDAIVRRRLRQKMEFAAEKPDELYSRLRAKYKVRIETPPAART
ncbi:MAG TPA: hypothetical protein VJ011_00390 [Steroidobacteraceae bacterium]|nr:hypothetical protein [Steroidobacteraceae bacterium]